MALCSNSGDTILNPAPLLFREDDKGIDTLLEPISESVYREKTVMPAKAGIQKCLKTWIPACAGMTTREAQL